MRKFLVVFCFFLSITLASSMEAQKRRAVASTSVAVNAVVFVWPSLTTQGDWVVTATSLEKLRAGTVWTGSLRKPGQAAFLPLPQRSFTVQAEENGLYYRGMQLWNGTWSDGGDKTLVGGSGAVVPWISGIATFRLDSFSPEGVHTWMDADIPVGSTGYPSVGPIDAAVVSANGDSIFLTPNGPFFSAVASLRGDFGFRSLPVWGTRIPVPNGVSGAVFVVVCAGYPAARCWTGQRDIPPPVGQ